MLRAALHRLVAHPRIYEGSQRIAGGEHVRRCIAERLKAYRDPVRVVADIGGGTGLFRNLWPDDVAYVCGELDHDKLRRFRARFHTDTAVCMDGASGIAPESCDAVCAIFVLHHVPDHAIDGFVAGCVRALRPGGVLVVAEPLWAPRRLAGRALWWVDRGSHPRTRAALRSIVSAHIPIVDEHETSVFHAYWIAIARKG